MNSHSINNTTTASINHQKPHKKSLNCNPHLQTSPLITKISSVISKIIHPIDLSFLSRDNLKAKCCLWIRIEEIIGIINLWVFRNVLMIDGVLITMDCCRNRDGCWRKEGKISFMVARSGCWNLKDCICRWLLRLSWSDLW